MEEGEVARLSDAVALVTGASRGIGRASALELAREGAAVVVAARDQEPLDDLAARIGAERGRALAVACDVGDREQVDAMVAATIDRFGGLQILVNAAQTTPPDACLESYPLDWWEPALRSGLFGTLFAMQAAFPHLQAAGEASIVNFGDPDAVVGEPGKAATNVTKEGIVALTRTAAREWGRYGIRVNAVNATARSERVATDLERDPSLEPWLASQIPSGVLGDPREVARAVVFLASSDSGMLTGSTIEVDGGRAMFA
jgi:NAD(P)-dependent dehydrogenase (short-subunit alcohol dehydrogenase family)